MFLAGRNPEKLRALVAALGDGGGVAGAREVDFTAPGAADAAVAAAVDALGGQLDVAVIAHGLLGDQLGSERDFAEAERILAANFVSVVALLVPLGNHFEAVGGGSIAERLARMPARPAKPCDEPAYLLPGVPVSMAAMNLVFALALAAGLAIWGRSRGAA